MAAAMAPAASAAEMIRRWYLMAVSPVGSGSGRERRGRKTEARERRKRLAHLFLDARDDVGERFDPVRESHGLAYRQRTGAAVAGLVDLAAELARDMRAQHLEITGVRSLQLVHQFGGFVAQRADGVAHALQDQCRVGL